MNAPAYKYSIWENQAHDRIETSIQLNKYLHDGINLITIQLSDLNGKHYSATETVKKCIKDRILKIEHIKEHNLGALKYRKLGMSCVY